MTDAQLESELASERPSLAELRTIDLFDELDDEQLARWQEVAEIRELPADTLVAAAGQGQTTEFILLLRGEVQGLIVEAGRVEPVTRQVAPTWMGAIPVLTETGFAGEMRSLTDVRLAVPEAPTSGIPATYVPARNTLMLALALGWAEVLAARDIFIGVNVLDSSGYPDCRPEFIAAFQELARLGTRAGIEGRRAHIHAPLIELTKA